MVEDFTTIEAALTSLEECAGDLESTVPCYDSVHSGRGYVVFKEFKGCQDSMILLPGFELLDRGLLVVVYSITYAWLFFGISIISDIFVGAIEVICSQTKKVKRKHPRTGEMVEVEEPVWNWVVANITLMAVGTSAPEILLALVETLMTLGSVPGELGPSCIVGSAAYNFLAITAVCTIAIAADQFKRIEQFRVFVTTCIWSIWAYIWMYLVFKVISPNEIELWEALLTLGFQLIFTLNAYLIDIQPWKRNKVGQFPDDGAAEAKAIEGGEAGSQRGLTAGEPASDEAAMNPQQKRHKSVLYYRALAVRQMAGESTAELVSQLDRSSSLNTKDDANRAVSGRFGDLAASSEVLSDKSVAKVGFNAPHYSVLESSGVAHIEVRRFDGDLRSGLSVHYRTVDGTAVAGLDYEATEGYLNFAPGEVMKHIDVRIVDDDLSEPDVTLSLELSQATGLSGEQAVHIFADKTSVTIVDDDEGGVLAFELPTYEVGCRDGQIELSVVRRNGADGAVTVEYATKDATAVAGTHYVAASGKVMFNRGETRAAINVPLVPCEVHTAHAFKVTLSNPLGGAVLGRRTECRAIIVPGNKAKGALVKAEGKAESKAAKSGDGEEEFDLWTEWGNQIKEAIMPKLEDEEGNVWVALFLHYTCITFKLIFAVAVPPAPWKGGYPCFFASLGMIVGIIFVTVEVAGLWGCVVGLSELMNGMSVTAVGTSLPDTFASKLAALHDDTADAAIGNITGSNCCNVFLGLGLPWVVAAIYYHAKGDKYMVKAGPLGFSIMMYCICFGVALIILMVRRYQGGELGGSKRAQWTQFGLYIGLWAIFLIMAGLYDYGHITTSSDL